MVLIQLSLKVTGSALVSPSFANGISSISFWVSGSGSAIQVNYSTDGGTTWTPASNSPFTDLTSTVVQKTVTFNTTVPTMIQLRRSAGTIYIDDIEFTYGSSTPDFVTGYAPKSVAGGSTVTAPVTGLTSGTKYYYRVRALNGSCNSVNSNVKDVTTLTPTTTWNGVALGWSNSAPNSNTNAIIAEDYNETINITAKNLTVNLGKTLTVKTNKYVKAEKFSTMETL